MLLPRFITALVGIPLVLTLIYFGSIPYLLFVVGVALLALREFFKLLEQGGYPVPGVLGPVFGVLFVLSLYWNGSALGTHTANLGASFMLTMLMLAFFLVEVMRTKSKADFLRPIYGLSGLLFVGWTLSHLILIREVRPLGREYSFFLYFLIWGVDIGAYAIGRAYGQRKLAPLISPGKSVEGALGGTLAGILVSVVVWFVTLKGAGWKLPEAVFLGCLTAIVAQGSDLVESLLKRTVQVKDSSDLLPGHGGVLDRFDSFIFAAPLFYYYIMIFHR